MIKTKNIILLLFIFLFTKAYAQEKMEYTDLYLYIDNSNFTGSKGEYIARFSIKSTDKRFSHDNYSFRIYDPIGEERNLYSLGKFINIDSLNYIIPEEHYKSTPACKTHNELSLTIKNNKLRIFIITKIPKDLLTQNNINDKKFMIWQAFYNGTVKDLSYINAGRGPFFTKK